MHETHYNCLYDLEAHVYRAGLGVTWLHTTHYSEERTNARHNYTPVRLPRCNMLQQAQYEHAKTSLHALAGGRVVEVPLDNVATLAHKQGSL